jgi:tetratricopeptide (TPR) repeat protein
MRTATIIVVTVLSTLCLSAQQKGGQPQPEWARQARQLITEAKFDEALAVYQKELANTPDSPQLNNATGVLLDLMGKGAEARKHFTKVIDAAQTNATKVSAFRAMAMSHAFEGDCKNTGKYEQMAIDIRIAEKDFYQQGEIADEAARVCIDFGDFAAAEKWYRLGHDSGIKDPELKPDMKDLWEFRLENALARIAARKGNKAEAMKHVAAAKALYEQDPKMGSTSGQDQKIFVPYLTGYVAFYTGDYNTARADLLQANQNDTFIQYLLGMTYEKLNDKDKAMEYFRKAASSTGHNPPVASGRTFAKKKLG